MVGVKPLEDLIRDFANRRSGPVRPRTIALIVAAVFGGLFVLIAIFSSWYTVPTDSRAVVKRFGRVVEIADPGLHFKWPFGIEMATIIQTERVQKAEFGFRTTQAAVRSTFNSKDWADESLMLTGDLNVVDVSWVVQYRITDPDRWMHASRDPVVAVRDLSESVMRRIVGNMIGSRVLTYGREELSKSVREELQRILDTYNLGISVQRVELRDVTPPDPVKPAFNEVNESRQEKERLVNIAETTRNELVPRARGEADQTIAEADAYAQERVNEARGDAARFAAILAEYEKAIDVTRRRLFLETVDAVLPHVQSLVIVDPKVGGPLPILDLNRLSENKDGGR